jgi:uncharacterized protein YjbI with pentapeptide repeats
MGYCPRIPFTAGDNDRRRNAVITEVGVASSTAFADTVIDGCTVVSNPTPTDNTDCVDMNLSGASLTNLDLSYADFEGSTLATTAT